MCYSCQNIRVSYFNICVQRRSSHLHDSRDAGAAGWLDHVVRDGVLNLLPVDRRTAGRQLLHWDRGNDRRVRTDDGEDSGDAAATLWLSLSVLTCWSGVNGGHQDGGDQRALQHASTADHLHQDKSWFLNSGLTLWVPASSPSSFEVTASSRRSRFKASKKQKWILRLPSASGRPAYWFVGGFPLNHKSAQHSENAVMVFFFFRGC